MKLKIELFRYKNTLFGRVLEQDESLRGVLEIKEVDGFKIFSCRSPELISKALFIRGRETKLDHSSFSHTYATKEEAIEMAEKIKKLVEMFNKDEEETETKIERII